jgi:hypothetical protein
LPEVRRSILLALLLTGLLCAPSAAADYVSHRLVVKFSDRAERADRARLRGRLEVVRARGLGGDHTVVYLVASDVSVGEALRLARGSEEVEYAEPDFIYGSALVPNDPQFGNQWGLSDDGTLCAGFICWEGGEKENDIGAVAAWEVSTGSASTIVGVVDSGIAYGHEDLAPQIATDPGETGVGREGNGIDDDGDGYVDNWRGWDIGEGDNDASDTEGHGTAMSGGAAAAPNNGLGVIGSAWEARILPVRAAPGNTFPSSNLAAAIRYAGSHGARVVNFSISGSAHSLAIEEAIESFPNVLFVAAAGNQSSSTPRYPCALDSANLLCVAATDREDHLAGFSNYGPHVDIAAPGVGILTSTLGGGYGYVSGTSPATALTSGAAALLRSFRPALTAAQVRQRLMAAVDPVPVLSGLVSTGGRLDIGNAMDFVPPETTIDPEPPALVEEPVLSVGFSSDDGQARFECRVNGGAWIPCSSGGEIGPLLDGPHTIAVRAVDRVGNVDPSPATSSFTVDAVPPVTTITAHPDSLVNSGTARFSFSASEPSTFECRLNEGPWTPCSVIGKIYNGLGDGEHSFSVRATDGNGRLEESPPVFTWAVDLTAPETVLESGPPPVSNSTSARFTYGSEPGAVFECRLDEASFAPCAEDGTSVAGLGDGKHEFAVRARDAAGNVDASPAARGFTVDTEGPSVRIDGGPPPESEGTSARFSYSSPEPRVSFQCRLDQAPFAPCEAGGTTFEGLAVGRHSFTVRGIDVAGNVGPEAPSYEFALRAHSTPRRPPTTSLFRKPPRRSARRNVVFVLAGGDRYRVRLDRRPWRTTAKRRLVLHVGPGWHVFAAVAVNRRGADPTPLRYRFRTLAPDHGDAERSAAAAMR